MKHMRIIILFIFFLVSLYGCGKTSVEDLVRKETASVVKPNVTFIENHEQFITLEYNESFTATSCSVSNLVGLSETTSCSCSAGVCTVGLTPTGTGKGSYTFTVSDGASSSDAEVITVETKEVVPFVSTWRVGDGAFGDGDLTVSLPLRSGFNYNFTVDWGDGTTEEVTAYNDPHINHTYGSAGNKVITISGLVEAWYFNDSGDKDKIISIQELGRVGWKSFENAFSSCFNLGQVLGGDTSEVVSMQGMFKSLYILSTYYNTTLQVDTSGWDTSKVTNMRAMFQSSYIANPDTSNWDTSSVENMSYMFHNARSANPDTSNWDTSNVTTMSSMFRDTEEANPSTSNWNVSSLISAGYMFSGAVKANPDTSSWDTSSLVYAVHMFSGAVVANPDVEYWDTSSLTNIRWMFMAAIAANPNVSNWDFTGVGDVRDFVNALTLSTENYDGLLVALDSSYGADPVTNFDAGGSTYTAAGDGGAARASLIAKGWTFSDGGGI